MTIKRSGVRSIFLFNATSTLSWTDYTQFLVSAVLEPFVAHSILILNCGWPQNANLIINESVATCARAVGVLCVFSFSITYEMCGSCERCLCDDERMLCAIAMYVCSRSLMRLKLNARCSCIFRMKCEWSASTCLFQRLSIASSKRERNKREKRAAVVVSLRRFVILTSYNQTRPAHIVVRCRLRCCCYCCALSEVQ